MPVVALNATDQAPLKIIQRSEQGDGAMADIIVRLRADMTDPQRQPWLGTLRSLHLAFFIAAEHQSLVRRGQVESDDVPEFLFKVRVTGQFKGAGQVRFKSLAAQSLCTLVAEISAARAMLRQLHRGSPMRG